MTEVLDRDEAQGVRDSPSSVVDAQLDILGWVESTLDHVLGGDLAGFDDGQLRRYGEGIERMLRRVDAAAVAVAGEVDASQRFRRNGYYSAKAWAKAVLGVSGPEAHGRVRTARMQRAMPSWREAATRGEVGAEQGRLMGRIAANPAVTDALADSETDLLDDARSLPFDDFDERARNWERLADPDGSSAEAERNHRKRMVTLRQRPDGSWKLEGSFGGVQGSEINKVLAHYSEAQWATDWADAVEVHGDDANVTHLARTELQRRADAFHAVVLAGATAKPSTARPEPTANILIDHRSAESWANGERPDPRRYREVVCRTQRGDPLHLDEAGSATLWAHVRRVVTDGSGTVTELGRRSRLFRGNSRDAVMLLHDRCLWPGCARPIDWCQADHCLEWRQHGATVPRNGAPLCKRHNLHKERYGFRVWRDDDGEWHVVDRSGNDIA